MHLYNKEDLAKLKDSKPIQITAHTHECIVPVVYSGMVNRFLESKGVHLPLTHHQLADMKREAGTPGYAKGTKDLKKKGKKGKKKEPKVKAPLINQSVNVVVSTASKSSASASGGGGSGGAGGKGSGGAGGGGGRGGMGGGGGGGDKARSFYNQLRPNNYAMIRSASIAPQQTYPVIDYGKEIREAKEKESAALEHYKKELETRARQMEKLEATMADVLKAKEPLFKPEAAIPLQHNDFDQAGQEAMSMAEYDRRVKEQEAYLKHRTEAMKAYDEEQARIKRQRDAEDAKRKLIGMFPKKPEQPAQPAVSAQPAQPAVSEQPTPKKAKKQKKKQDETKTP